MSDTSISPSVGALTLAGVAAALISGSVTARVPTIGALALSGVAPSVVSQLQTPDISGVVNLLTADSKTGIVKRWPGGAGMLAVVGTWGGASCQFQFAGPDGGVTMLPIGSALTANGVASFSLPPGYIQAAITGGSGTSLTAAAQSVPTLIG